MRKSKKSLLPKNTRTQKRMRLVLHCMCAVVYILVAAAVIYSIANMPAHEANHGMIKKTLISKLHDKRHAPATAQD